MPLGSALIDRARVRRSRRSNTRIEGGFQQIVETGPWFRCFYSPGGRSQSSSGGGSRRMERGTILLYGRKALDGSEVDVNATDILEIESKAHGDTVMQVDGQPTVIAKKTTKIGSEAQLVKVDRVSTG